MCVFSCICIYVYINIFVLERERERQRIYIYREGYIYIYICKCTYTNIHIHIYIYIWLVLAVQRGVPLWRSTHVRIFHNDFHCSVTGMGYVKCVTLQNHVGGKGERSPHSRGRGKESCHELGDAEGGGKHWQPHMNASLSFSFSLYPYTYMCWITYVQ